MGLTTLSECLKWFFYARKSKSFMFQVSFIQLPSNSLKGRSQNVGLPDKSHFKPFDHLPIPPDIQGIPPDTEVLGAY